MQSEPVVSLRYFVRPSPEAWEIPEGTVPQSTAHQAAVLQIYQVLVAWASECAPAARVASDLALRWLERYPKTGINPDVCLFDPAPADFDQLESLKLWEPGRLPPKLSIEVVSRSHPFKDYSAIHERYAALGTEELLVFDPLLAGPKSLGGPVSLQLWRPDATGAFERTHFSNEPVYSAVLGAWFVANGRRLEVARDRRGEQRWLDAAERAELAKSEAKLAKGEAERAKGEAERAKGEAERAKSEAERAKGEAERAKGEAERERRAREDLERRVRELEAKRSPA